MNYFNKYFSLIIFLSAIIGTDYSLSADFNIYPSSCGIGKSFFLEYIPDNPGIKSESLKISFMDKEYFLFRDKNKYLNHIGISLKSKPGEYEIKYNAFTEKIIVYEVPYSSETIEMSDSLIDEESIMKESRIIGKILKQVSHKKYYSGDFITPIKYTKISSGFGMKRVYNDGRLAWQHKGIDFVNKTGTPVYAPNTGRVSLSKKLKIHGNTIIIDHGRGIFTIYNHLQKRSVKEQQIIKRGQRIGALGKTGMVTGPHLHFGLSVGNERVDPYCFLKK